MNIKVCRHDFDQCVVPNWHHQHHLGDVNSLVSPQIY